MMPSMKMADLIAELRPQVAALVSKICSTMPDLIDQGAQSAARLHRQGIPKQKAVKMAVRTIFKLALKRANTGG
jgi:hypothetical protein